MNKYFEKNPQITENNIVEINNRFTHLLKKFMKLYNKCLRERHRAACGRRQHIHLQA